MGKSAVYMIVNKQNNKRYVGISEDVENEWFNIKRNLDYGIGIRKMREDYVKFGKESFDFIIVFESDQLNLLHRKESELAYQYDVWHKGYNSEPLLNYSRMTEERLAFEKLRLYKLVDQVKDGKYLCMDLIDILGITKNDLLVLLREITLDEMKFFKKEIILRNGNLDLAHMYIQIKSFEFSIDK